MNNTFAFNRFKNLLLKDGKMYIRNFGTSLIVWCCLNAIFWIFNLLFGSSTMPPVRFGMLCIWTALAMMMVPSKVYGNANLSREGVGFAMMPASSLEKFISMFIYCAIVTPIVVFFGGYLVDAFLSIFPFGGFEKPIHLYSLNEIFYKGINNEGSPIHLNSPSDAMALSIAYMMRVSFYAGIIQWSAIFMLGNMLFKKHKAGKTFASYLGISYLISMIMGLVFFNREIMEGWIAKFEGMSTEQQIQWFQNATTWGMVVGIIITLLLLFFTYRKIKTQKY